MSARPEHDQESRAAPPLVIAGVGFRRSVAADELVALVDEALRRAALSRRALAGLATAAALADNAAFRDAAEHLGINAIAVPTDDLQAGAAAGRTCSQRSLATHGVGSVAEAAALGGAGPGASLVLARIASAGATCALARG